MVGVAFCPLMVRVETVLSRLSSRETVMFALAAVFGVSEMTPVWLLYVKPAGRPEIDHL